MNIRTEQEIINSWKYVDEIYVSVVCMTYNQETYIKTAVDSFLKQEFDYKYEIIIHDDASTDSTPQIIQQYLSLYPNIIKVIKQKVNQYSIKPTLPSINTLNEAQGRYIAICEGDDYWIDSRKLKLQFEKLEANPSVNLCFHSYKYIIDGQFSDSKLSSFQENVPFEDIVLAGGGGLCTASLFIRRCAMLPLPKFFRNAPVGDYFMQVIAASSGGAIYLNENMAAYRVNSIGSWSASIKSRGIVYQVKADEMVSAIKDLDCFFLERYSVLFKKAIAKEYQAYSLKALKNHSYQDFNNLIKKSWYSFRLESPKQTILFFGRKFSFLYVWFISIEERFRTWLKKR
ncbi:glycosyltransferase [Colwelliaceae bacterium MEBiC 14330]